MYPEDRFYRDEAHFEEMSENVTLNERVTGIIIFESKRHTSFHIFYV